MKFRAVMTSAQYIRTFAQLLQALSRCSKGFILRITVDKMIFILDDNKAANPATAIGAWAEVPKHPYASDYGMEGHTVEDNQIVLEISPEKIAACLAALRTANNVDELRIKLTKKTVPCLTFEIDFREINSSTTPPTCVHDVPVQIVRKIYWIFYKELNLPAFDIRIEAPELKNMRLALERLKNLGPRVLIKASTNGKLCLSVETYNVKCNVKFQDLKIVDIGPNGVTESQPAANPRAPTEYTVNVDTRTILNLLTSEFIFETSKSPFTFVLSLSDFRMLHLYYQAQHITLQYCLPSVVESMGR